MLKRKVGIIAECCCDLSQKIINEYDIGIVYFLIETDSGVFTDTEEITAENILTYLINGGKRSVSHEPPASVYINIFEEYLEKYDKIIYISISAGLDDSTSYLSACNARSQMGENKERIYVFDSQHVSTGMGLIVLKAAQMAREGLSAEDILPRLEKLREMVSTTFIVQNVDFLYSNGHVTKSVKKICDKFNIHPVITMKDGKMVIKNAFVGDTDKAAIRYIKSELKSTNKIDNTVGFITQSGCPVKKINYIKQLVEQINHFDQLIVTKASATISSNCGPNTLGIIFLKKDT